MSIGFRLQIITFPLCSTCDMNLIMLYFTRNDLKGENMRKYWTLEELDEIPM